MPHPEASERLEQEAPQLVRASTAAFALISASDGEIAASESARYEEWLKARSESQDFQAQAMAEFSELCALLQEDFDAGRALARTRIEETPAQASSKATVLAAARAALVADERIESREEMVLGEICELLGLDPSEG